MKLNKEMIDLAISSNQKCTIYGDYVLLYKHFSVKDEELDEYIRKINGLKTKGISTVAILDYYKTNTSSYGYSKVVILEEKAPGRNLDYKNISIYLKTAPDFEKSTIEYINNLDDYINELEIRSNAPQSVFDKFVTDYMSIINSDLMIDPKPLNFYFDKDAGFTFIDINGSGKDDLKYLPRYFLGAALGYGVPNLYIQHNNCSYIDGERFNRLKDSIVKIIEKVAASLIKYGYSKEEVTKASFNWTNQLTYLKHIDSIADLSNKLAEEYARIKDEEKLKKQNVEESEWTVGW